MNIPYSNYINFNINKHINLCIFYSTLQLVDILKDPSASQFDLQNVKFE